MDNGKDLKNAVLENEQSNKKSNGKWQSTDSRQAAQHLSRITKKMYRVNFGLWDNPCEWEDQSSKGCAIHLPSLVPSRESNPSFCSLSV